MHSSIPARELVTPHGVGKMVKLGTALPQRKEPRYYGVISVIFWYEVSKRGNTKTLEDP